jgi:hypothetical protein
MSGIEPVVIAPLTEDEIDIGQLTEAVAEILNTKTGWN